MVCILFMPRVVVKRATKAALNFLRTIHLSLSCPWLLPLSWVWRGFDELRYQWPVPCQVHTSVYRSSSRPHPIIWDLTTTILQGHNI